VSGERDERTQGTTVKPRVGDHAGFVRWTGNGVAVALADVPTLAMQEFRETCVSVLTSGGRLSALTLLGTEAGAARGREMIALLADDAGSRIGMVRTPVPGSGRYPALAADFPQAQAFEREILEDHGIIPEGHPWPKALRHHADLEPRGGQERRPVGAHSFFRVEGAGVHEVAVGPVHAGIIEPGHFRFQCHGEKVLHLETQLGYQHRGAESLFLRSKPERRLTIAESIAGDTVIGHALAHAAAIEGLSGADVPLGAQAIRGIALELERVANHVGDLGALCGDTAYLPGAAWFGRLRGEFLNMLLEISGNRFGRGLVVPGGVGFGVDPVRQSGLLEQLDRLEVELDRVSEIVFESPSVISRFEQTGILTRDDAEELAVVGPAARASGCDRDVRRDHPSGIYRFAHVPVALQETGDVMARAIIRRTEAQRSIQFVREHLVELKAGRLMNPLGPGRPNACLASLVEGWRGEIAHVAITDEAGHLAGYKIVDPSFHNWLALAMVMRDRQISDFPLCNKSFNLSYAGHDL
jgi:Ni,Fe-hydrogenase III large subunit